MLAAGMIVATPANAGLLQLEPTARLGTPDAGWRALAEGATPRLRGEAALPSDVPALRVGAPHGGPLGLPKVAACDGCTPGMVPTEAPRHSSALPVNVAILVLGSLWLTLMVRRIQLRLGSESLNGGARPHAAGGH